MWGWGKYLHIHTWKILNKAVRIPYGANSLGKGMHPTILFLAMDKF